jgi:hypothetical protein
MQNNNHTPNSFNSSDNPFNPANKSNMQDWTSMSCFDDLELLNSIVDSLLMGISEPAMFDYKGI